MSSVIPILPILPLLIFAWGNPSRGDDALGPLFIDQLQQRLEQQPGMHSQVTCITDFQLQPEHALDLLGRTRVLFVDASLSAPAPFEVSELAPQRDASFSTHAMSPQAVMQVYRQIHGHEPPPCTLLAIRGQSFELGEAPSNAALQHLHAALAWCEQWLAREAAHA